MRREHLYRAHALPKNRCNRCCVSFTDGKALAAHQRSSTPCPLQDIESYEDISEAQEAMLRARATKKEELKPEHEKWKDIYKILYPDVKEDRIPSPCERT
jgi:hypothetical protein